MQLAHPSRTTLLAVLFEGALGGLALAAGWLLGHWPAAGMEWDSSQMPRQLMAAGWGLVATLPLIVGLLVIDRAPLSPIQRLREEVHHLIRQMFGGASVLQLAVVAIAAGLGEELLFRGLVQGGLTRLIGGPAGPWIALAIAAVVFGVCHWLSATYAALAALAGAYFGWLFIVFDSIWTPVVAHAAYDFLALVYLIGPNRLVRSSV
jgi:membrane protease YdiL (CAAX protease family)